ncbi:helix-turn-helix transcriptional regulator [Acidovorax sp. BLS4]|uniref:helix-turn-helix domain-containing protein n=1 Tax=Acidovorax sp. BLS4 TaxID=3273430 RepID=UPI002942A87C|nr:helix-turn-helix transcriptional regulator [Paracidovorax avenae]WOI47723.1 helix-turn-helix transcriptional regulator [Paracidovorax avenae]
MGARIREERGRLGFSQQKAADMAGVRREMWAKYEAGAEPGAKTLAGMVLAGVDVRYVLTGGRDNDFSAEERLMLEYFREASKDARRAAFGALLGAPVPTQVGGSHSQHSSGNGAIQIGSIERAPVKRRR